MKKGFSSEELANILKGGANHYRVDVLRLLDKKNKLILDDIASDLGANYKTISAHLYRLHRSGLIVKRYKGAAVEHSLSPRGKQVLKFLRILE